MPVSGEAVRQFVASAASAGDDPSRGEEALRRLLRLAFPLRWRNLWAGDPVRLVLRSPLRDALVAELVRLPPVTVVRSEPDEWDRLRALHQDTEEVVPGLTVTLDLVCRLTEVVMGATWYYAPARWATADGYAPLDEVWRAWETVQRARAFERLNVIRAIAVTRAGERASTLYEDDVREVFGG